MTRQQLLDAMDVGKPITTEDIGHVAASNEDIRYLQRYAFVKGYRKYDIHTDIWTTEPDC